MSEYQYVAFRAVDGTLDDKQLAFAEKQSCHSDLSRWEVKVEYNYSSLRGDVDGLLRRGFDVHPHTTGGKYRGYLNEQSVFFDYYRYGNLGRRRDR